MTKNQPPKQDTVSEAQSTRFQDLLNEELLTEVFKKHGLELEKSRTRKLPLMALFWLMILSAGSPSARGSLRKLTALLLASIALLPWGGQGEIAEVLVNPPFALLPFDSRFHGVKSITEIVSRNENEKRRAAQTSKTRRWDGRLNLNYKKIYNEGLPCTSHLDQSWVS